MCFGLLVPLYWVLWNKRNKASIFEGIFPSQPTDNLYKISVYLHVGKQVVRRRDHEALELTIGMIRLLHQIVLDIPE